MTNGAVVRNGEDEDFDQVVDGMRGELNGYNVEHACR